MFFPIGSFLQWVITAAFIFGGVAIVIIVAVMRKQGKSRAKALSPTSGKNTNKPAGSTTSNHAPSEVEAKQLQLDQSTQVIRTVLLDIASAVQKLDGAADQSNDNLSSVRDSVRGMKLPSEVSDCQRLILSEIDKVLNTNQTLRKELADSRNHLANQRRKIESLQSAIRIDALTQIANRAHFDEYVNGAFKQYQRYGEAFSLMIIDIDHFKQVNDRFGHQAGDRILKAVALKLKANLRGSDFVARYGGEEFAAVLLRAPLEQALTIADNARDSIETTAFSLDGANMRVTVSIGVSQVNKNDSVETLIKRADEALYEAKEGGRNQVRPTPPLTDT